MSNKKELKLFEHFEYNPLNYLS